MRFRKYQAIGNDYLVLEEGPVDPALVRRLCDRRFGVGSDGVLAPVPAPDGAHGLRIANPDGSPAGISGNGLRIFARWLFDVGRVGAAPFVVATPSRRVRVRVLAEGAEVEVAMGPASFAAAEVPFAGPERELVDAPIEAGGETLRVTAVGMGNPHAVMRVAEPTEALARRLGPLLERHPRFPERTNVQFVRVESRTRLRAVVWERGAGLTLGSGSSACAVASAMRRLGLCDASATVAMAGGELRIEIDDDGAVTMRGPVRAIAAGVAADDLLRDAARGAADVPSPAGL